MLRVPFHDLEAALLRATLRLGLKGERAILCSRLFAETTLDGVYTHGLNRFPRFAATVANGGVDPKASPLRVAAFEALERWDGHLGPGNLAAHASMSRAIELARAHGVGVVALANTNHWMRGGTYGWMAADAGVFAACWTNTMPNLPAWGTALPVLGNNPLVLAVPRTAGPIVLDMAMSQFSYGTLAAYGKRGDRLPVPGGYDTGGILSTDAAAIEATQRALPIGFWKGSGLSTMLDLFAAMLSGGQATHQLSTDPARESGVSQFFLAIDPGGFDSSEERDRIAEDILASIHTAPPLDPDHPTRYPGEQTLRLREENLRLGVPVDPEIWNSLLAEDDAGRVDDDACPPADDKPLMSADHTQAPVETRTFNVSPVHSRYIDGLLESGAYLSASEVLRAGIRALQERDEAIDRWLSEDVASVLDAVQAEARRPVPAATVFAAVRARYADRRKKSR